jgi:hypothetical protein
VLCERGVDTLVVGDLDDIAVGIRQHADVPDRRRKLTRRRSETTGSLGVRRDLVDVASLRDLDSEVRERCEDRLERARVCAELDED